MSEPEEYTAGRIVAERPPTNGAQRVAIISTFGQQDMSSWRGRDVLRVVDDVTFQVVQRTDRGQVQSYGEDFGQVVWSQRGTPASVSGSRHLPTTGVRSSGDFGFRNVACPMGMVSEDVTCIRVGQRGVIVLVPGMVIHQLNPSGAGEAGQARAVTCADVHRPWSEVGRASAGIQLTSPEMASAAAALMGLSAGRPGRSHGELQRDVVSG